MGFLEQALEPVIYLLTSIITIYGFYRAILKPIFATIKTINSNGIECQEGITETKEKIMGVCEQIQILQLAQQAVLRDRILYIYKQHEDTNEIITEEYSSLVELYGAYKDLKGNHFVDKLMEKMEEKNIKS